jgi:asparagine synthase (glutamine-hydrolysing)
MGALLGVLGAVSERETAAMVERLRHRGPRTHIEHFDGLVIASLDDEPAGKISSRGELSLVCDASVLHDDDLRSRLRERDVHLAGDSPAELLLAAYDTFGAAALEVAGGTFALAVVDRAKREVVFARDFFGNLPLFYTVLAGGGIAFASEYKALLCLSDVRREADRDMLQYLQCAKKLPPGRTLLKEVHSARHGAVTKLDFHGRELDTHAFPELRVDVQTSSEEEAASRLIGEFRGAIRRQCGERERIGVALSGGIDSIAVACVLRELFPDRRIDTFTASNGPDDPESITAGQVAERIGSIHHSLITPNELLDTTFDDLVFHLEDPYARCETLQLFELGKVADAQVDVLLSGQGADSLFGGMPRYRLLRMMKPLLRFPLLRASLTEFYNLTQLGLTPTTVLGKALHRAYYRGKLPKVPVILGAHGFPDAIELPRVQPEFVNVAMARGFQNGQSQDFPKYERCFAAYGLRYRSPFCDVRFARFAFSISDSLKIRRGTQKYILRKAMKSAVPDEFLSVPKHMQSLRQDLDFSDILDRLCARVLERSVVERRGFFRYSDIERLRRRPPGEPYTRDAAMRLWTVLATELWARRFLDNERGSPGPVSSYRGTATAD